MLKLMFDNKTGKLRKAPLLVIVLLVVAVFALAVVLNRTNTKELTAITEESVKSELISICHAASEIVDVEAFASYNTEEDVAADQSDYDYVLAKLRVLQTNVKAEYIYAMKYIDGQWQFIFDTDTEDETIFTPYELDEVLTGATKGIEGAVLNVEDESGTFNTGAIPVYYNGEIVGIMAVDKDADILENSKETATRNSIILAVAMAVILCALLIFLFYLLERIKDMQDNLRKMAHNDTITGLPNRLYLFEYLDEHMSKKPEVPFALVFIDLDNFKSVNDLAGHDAGDELLRKMGQFLNNEGRNAKTFHPAAGYLNVSARVGGDEFIMVYPGAETVEDATEIAEKIFEAYVPEKISRLATKYNVSLSIGVALYPYHSENYHAIIKYADSAMYQAKKAGKNRYCIYTEGMQGADDEK